ncbi:MFS transporter [Dactylosporangium sp. NPDC000244]|uniref:MFS transporter n=1 Tax=Dactylosporangium sp. NPDC000244 TaxID=3154365 RepID=UPI0033284935
MTGYRRVLAVPGMAPLLGVSLLARTAMTADVMALTMVVVLGLHRSYAAAGVVAAALTAGIALGGPLLGRAIDRRGVRKVLVVTSGLQVVFWLGVPLMPYDILVCSCVVAGLLMVPAQSVTRQAIAAMTTPEQRRPAFALEAVQGEVSYIVGPALVIVCAAQTSPGLVAGVVGAAIAAGGFGLARLDPPVRTAEEAGAGAGERPPRRQWLGAGLVAVLMMGVGATALLSGVDLAIVAVLREADQMSWAAGVVAVFGVASVTGGLLYGALPRSLPTWVLLGLLALVTVPAGLARTWPWLCVAVVGIGLLTAPTLSAIADAVSRLVPAAVRGEATGLQSSAQSGGFAVGSPLAGLAIDLTGPAGGFAAAGLAALVTALIGGVASLRAAPLRGGRTDCI